MIIGRNLADFNLTPRELDVVKAGMTDMVQKKKTAVELETYGPKVDALHTSRRTGRAAAEKEAGKKAVEAAAREPGAVKTAAGAIVRTVKPGTGAVPQPTDRVKVNYTGQAARRHRVRQLAEAGPAGRRFRSTASSSAGPKAWAHEGRRAGGADLPVGHRVRRRRPGRGTSRRARRWSSTSS